MAPSFNAFPFIRFTPEASSVLSHMSTSMSSPSRSFRPRFGLRERLELDDRDRSRRFFFERLSSLFDRLRLRLFARVTVMNLLLT